MRSKGRRVGLIFPVLLITPPLACGRSASGANADSPLKSPSSSCSISGECSIAIDRANCSRVSDLPDPVIPVIIPCGPIPPSAASLRSKNTVLPVVGLRPNGILSRSGDAEVSRDHTVVGSQVRASSMWNTSRYSWPARASAARSASSLSASSEGSQRANARANASASAIGIASGVAANRRPLGIPDAILTI